MFVYPWCMSARRRLFCALLRERVAQERTTEIDAAVARWLLEELTALTLAEARADTPTDSLDPLPAQPQAED